MSEWKTYRLSDLINLVGGGTPKTTVPEYWNGEIPWLSVVDFGKSIKKVYQTEKSITEKGLNESSTKILKEGQIIISARGTVGELAVLGRDMAFNQSCYGIYANDKTENNFLYYLLKYSIGKIKKNTHGAVFDTITKQTFDNIEVSIPENKATQKEIAQILSSLDDKIELNLQMNQTLEAMAQAIFKEWFVNFNFPGFDGELVDGLPKGWRMGSFEELTDIKTGKGLKRTEFKPDGIYPIIGANGELGRTDEYLLDDKLLLTGRVGTLGSIKISYGKKWYSDNVLIMKPYKYFYFSYFNLKAIDMNSLNRGSTQPLVTQTDLKNYLTLIPSEEILLLFEKTVNEIFEKIFFNDIQIQTLTQTRDTLLPKLMSGQLEVV